jgi:hypothetical protein
MEKSSNFFVISNFNIDPYKLTKYCHDYIIYDQSNKPEIISLLKNKKDPKLFFVKHSGNNMTDYIRYIIENYDRLPDTIVFSKSNLIGRYIEEKDFERFYRRKRYTFLYSDSELIEKPGVQYLTDTVNFIEINNGWFVEKSVHRYFISTHQFLSFFFKDVRPSKYINFAPGGCYIVEKERIKYYPRSFYLGIQKVIDYTFFPSEVWILERVLNIIFQNVYECKDIVLDESALLREIDSLPDLTLVDSRVKFLRRVEVKLRNIIRSIVQ